MALVMALEAIDATGLGDLGNKSTVYIHELIYFQGAVCPFGKNRCMERNVKGQVGTTTPVPRPPARASLGTSEMPCLGPHLRPTD